jgi:hypothetical protein
MARGISEIKRVMTDAFIADKTVASKYELEPDKTFDEQFKKTSIENIWFYCAAVGIWTLEKLFDLFRNEIDKKLTEQTPHKAMWYANKIKAFQYGDELEWDTDVYSVIDESKQIVKHCAVTDVNGMLFVKVAKMDGDLTALNNAEQNSLKAYIDRVRDAGVVYVLRSSSADLLNVELTLHFDPLVLNKNGKRIDGSNDNPVQETIDNYLKYLPFNGEYSNMALVDSVRTVAGVKVAQLTEAKAQYGANPYVTINSVYIPDAGYMRLSNVIIKYVPHDY